MLHILLLILKIIGILLLCLLVLLLSGLMCALFVPVRYRIEAVRKEDAGEPPVVVRVKVTWLLHMVNLIVRFDGSLFVRARLMVFTLFRLPKKEKKGRERKPGKADVETAGQEKTAESGAAETPVEKAESGVVQEEENTAEAEATMDGPDESMETEPGEESEEKASFLDRLRAVPKILRGIFLKIRSLFENIQYTIQKFCDKIKSASDTIEYYRGVVEGEPFQRSFALCKGELIRIGKSLKPQKFQAQLLVGMDDPAATGQILAVCGMLYPLLGGHVDVAGDFERKRLEGRVFVKGKIRFFTFLRVAVRVYFNKDIRKLYKLLKKEAV